MLSWLNMHQVQCLLQSVHTNYLHLHVSGWISNKVSGADKEPNQGFSPVHFDTLISTLKESKCQARNSKAFIP